MIKEMHEAMNGWLIVERMTRFRQVNRDIIDVLKKKVRKVYIELSVRSSMDEDAAQNKKARDKKAEDGSKKKAGDERSERGKLDG